MNTNEKLPANYLFQFDEFVFRDKTPDRTRYIRITLRATISDDTKPLIVVYLRDITDYERMRGKDGRSRIGGRFYCKDDAGYDYGYDYDRTMRQLLGKLPEPQASTTFQSMMTRVQRLIQAFIANRV
jgi:hypothetical protein